MNDTTMAALAINTSHASYEVIRKTTPLGDRWSVMVLMAGGKRRKEMAMCETMGAAYAASAELNLALRALHRAGEAIAK